MSLECSSEAETIEVESAVTWECCEGTGKRDGFSTTFSALKKGAGEGFVCLF